MNKFLYAVVEFCSLITETNSWYTNNIGIILLLLEISCSFGLQNHWSFLLFDFPLNLLIENFAIINLHGVSTKLI